MTLTPEGSERNRRGNDSSLSRCGCFNREVIVNTPPSWVSKTPSR